MTLTPRQWEVLRACGIGLVMLVIVLALMVGIANFMWNSMHRPFLDRLKQVRPGCTEGRVLELLGDPAAIHEVGESIDWDVEYSTYGHPGNWTAERRVLVFIGPSDHVPSDYIVFVRMGSDGRVQETYVGGT